MVKVRGLGIGPRFMHWVTDGRREVEELSGQRAVPVLVTDDGEVVADSKRIVEWAEAHPAHRAGRRLPLRGVAPTASTEALFAGISPSAAKL